MASNTYERSLHFFSLHMRPDASHSKVENGSCTNCIGKSVLTQKYPLCFDKNENTLYQCTERYIYTNLLDANHKKTNHPLTVQNRQYSKFI